MTITTRLATTLITAASMALLAGAGDRPAYLDPTLPIDTRVDDLLSRMTLEEKIGQMNMPCVYESRLGQTQAAKAEACRRFAAGTLEPGIGPGGGFFTLPNTILQEGPRQQAAFLNELQREPIGHTDRAVQSRQRAVRPSARLPQFPHL